MLLLKAHHERIREITFASDNRALAATGEKSAFYWNSLGSNKPLVIKAGATYFVGLIAGGSHIVVCNNVNGLFTHSLFDDRINKLQVPEGMRNRILITCSANNRIVIIAEPGGELASMKIGPEGEWIKLWSQVNREYRGPFIVTSQ